MTKKVTTISGCYLMNKTLSTQKTLLEDISFKKSLLKARVRRELPWPVKINLHRPVFVIGSSRSGTTILAEVLSYSPKLYSFTEHPLIRRHMWKVVEKPETTNYELPQLEKSLVRLSGIRDKQRLLEKTPGHSLVAHPLANYFADAQFVHIVRDARDVAPSMLKHEWIADELRGIHPVFWFHLLPKEFQNEWKDLNLWERAVLRWAVYLNSARDISSSDRYLEIKYEEMCQIPRATFDRLLSFLGIEWSSELEAQISKIRPQSANRWKSTEPTERQERFLHLVLTTFKITLSES